MSRQLRLGVVGCADIAWRAMIPAMMDIPEIELVAVASRSRDKAERFASNFNCDAMVGYQQLLDRDDITVVYMPLPTGLHEEWVCKALDAEKHVLIEKSFAMDYESAERMVKEARKSNLLIVENFLFPLHSQNQFVEDVVSGGELGEVHLFRSTFGFPSRPAGDFRYDPDLGGGSLIDAGCYVLKAARLFLGDDLGILGAFLEHDDELKVDVRGGAMLKNAQGVIAQLAFGFNYYYQCNYEIIGSNGKLLVSRAFTAPQELKPLVRMEQQDYEQVFALPSDNQYRNMWRSFSGMISDKGLYESAWRELLNQARLMECVRKEASL